MSETTKLILTLVVTLVGAGLGTTIVGALFKRRFDSQLETHKALLQRNSRIHERQVEALVEIHSNLEEALFYLQRATSRGRFEGEPNEQELLRRMATSIGSASNVFSRNRLLISGDLGRVIDEFFSKMIAAGTDLRVASDPLAGMGRAAFTDSARTLAYREIPKLLEAIRVESRNVIHG